MEPRHTRLRTILRGMRSVSRFERLSQAVTDWSGRSETVVVAFLLVVMWGVTGPYFRYSDTWQLVINTLTNLITFVMVFLIQRSQNKDTLAIQLKLNEIIAALHGASNQLIAIEDLSEDQLRTLHARYQRLMELTADRSSGRGSVSIEALPHREAAETRVPPAIPVPASSQG